MVGEHLQGQQPRALLAESGTVPAGGVPGRNKPLGPPAELSTPVPTSWVPLDLASSVSGVWGTLAPVMGHVCCV